ncbi:PTS mannose transporter subunit IID [Candidatus Riesia pediculicola]|uniref:PTS mannose transporter subunit IID n=1 Tax=Candidatus Riesia pediculicola TaxID=401619 RepID=UPI00178CE429|nr:PTS mannose transporter subunit IID [Candidatus Riesia pediculicola]QOJ86285.1 PTS mannose transporter subunit IID [Candidatus Riesia pediculicola]
MKYDKIQDKHLKKISSTDLFKVFLRTHFFQGSWNFERMQALGFCFSMIPIIKKLYPRNDEKRKNVIRRHLEFFNTHPYIASPILGIVTAMEEKKVLSEKDFQESSINSMKIGLMGPLAGIGDPVFWGTVRPVFSSLGAGIAINGSLLGPILFFFLFNIVRISIKYFGVIYGYRKGTNLIEDINKGGMLRKITEGATIVGLFVMGALVNKWTHINIPLVVSKIKNQKDGSIVVTTVQDILDQLMPGIVPLSLTFFCIWLLRKKVNSLFLIIFLFFIGILGSWTGFLS